MSMFRYYSVVAMLQLLQLLLHTHLHTTRPESTQMELFPIVIILKHNSFPVLYEAPFFSCNFKHVQLYYIILYIRYP